MSKYKRKGAAQCSVCGKEFKHRGALMGHLRFAHKQIEDNKVNVVKGKYEDIDPDIEDAKYRMKQQALFEKNKETKRKIFNFKHANSLNNG